MYLIFHVIIAIVYIFSLSYYKKEICNLLGLKVDGSRFDDSDAFNFMRIVGAILWPITLVIMGQILGANYLKAKKNGTL